MHSLNPFWSQSNDQVAQAMVQAFVGKVALLHPSVQKWNPNEAQSGADEYVDHQCGPRVMLTTSVSWHLAKALALKCIMGLFFANMKSAACPTASGILEALLSVAVLLGGCISKLYKHEMRIIKEYVLKFSGGFTLNRAAFSAFEPRTRTLS